MSKHLVQIRNFFCQNERGKHEEHIIARSLFLESQPVPHYKFSFVQLIPRPSYKRLKHIICYLPEIKRYIRRQRLLLQSIPDIFKFITVIQILITAEYNKISRILLDFFHCLFQHIIFKEIIRIQK